MALVQNWFKTHFVFKVVRFFKMKRPPRRDVGHGIKHLSNDIILVSPKGSTSPQKIGVCKTRNRLIRLLFPVLTYLSENLAESWRANKYLKTSIFEIKKIGVCVPKISIECCH